MPKQKKTRSNALVCMKAILATAILLTGLGFTLRRTLLAGLPQYEGAPDLAVPFMLLQDSGPLREARARAAWEAAHAPQEPSTAPAPAPETLTVKANSFERSAMFPATDLLIVRSAVGTERTVTIFVLTDV